MSYANKILMKVLKQKFAITLPTERKDNRFFFTPIKAFNFSYRISNTNIAQCFDHGARTKAPCTKAPRIEAPWTKAPKTKAPRDKSPKDPA